MHRRSRAFYQVNDLAHVHDLTFAYAGALARLRDIAATPTCDRDLADARDLVGDLAGDLASALIGSQGTDLARDLADAFASDLVMDPAGARTSTCAFTVDHAVEQAQLLERSLQATATRRATGNTSLALGRMSRALVTLATRALPAPNQLRYWEEFHAELIELPRRERLRYALRLLMSAWELRRALTETRRTPDKAAVRLATDW